MREEAFSEFTLEGCSLHLVVRLGFLLAGHDLRGDSGEEASVDTGGLLAHSSSFLLN